MNLGLGFFYDWTYWNIWRMEDFVILWMGDLGVGNFLQLEDNRIGGLGDNYIQRLEDR